MTRRHLRPEVIPQWACAVICARARRACYDASQRGGCAVTLRVPWGKRSEDILEALDCLVTSAQDEGSIGFRAKGDLLARGLESVGRCVVIAGAVGQHEVGNDVPQRDDAALPVNGLIWIRLLGVRCTTCAMTSSRYMSPSRSMAVPEERLPL